MYERRISLEVVKIASAGFVFDVGGEGNLIREKK